jgi:hypothetical protein
MNEQMTAKEGERRRDTVEAEAEKGGRRVEGRLDDGRWERDRFEQLAGARLPQTAGPIKERGSYHIACGCHTRRRGPWRGMRGENENVHTCKRK